MRTLFSRSAVSRLALSATLMISIMFSSSLDAAEPAGSVVWSCWHSASGNQARSVSMGLIQEDGVVKIEGADFIEYSILQDNSVGLVAVISYAEASSRSKHLGADVLVIDKVTLDFKKGNVFAPGAQADNMVRSGKCVLRP